LEFNDAQWLHARPRHSATRRRARATIRRRALSHAGDRRGVGLVPGTPPRARAAAATDIFAARVLGFLAQGAADADILATRMTYGSVRGSLTRVAADADILATRMTSGNVPGSITRMAADADILATRVTSGSVPGSLTLVAADADIVSKATRRRVSTIRR